MASPSPYPNLFTPTRWPTGSHVLAVHFARDIAVPEPLVSNVNVVPRVGHGLVMIQLATGDWEVPGGTIEPGEHYLDAARRELLEESGAIMGAWTIIGAWHCLSSAPRPHRPHLPHPESYRLVLTAAVDLVGPPTNPPHGEQVALVDVVPATIAAARFTAQGRPDLADLYFLAQEFAL